MSPPDTSAHESPGSRIGSRGRRAGWWALAVALVLLGSGLRAFIDGRAELAKAHEAELEAEIDEEIMHLGRAARWRLPFAGHDETALAGLESLATDADLDVTASLLAYREIRRALLATRTPWGVSDPQLLARADSAIVRLMADDSDPEREDRLVIQLSEPRDAPNAGTWLASLFFVAWLGALYGFFVRAIDEQAHLVRRSARIWGLLVLLTCMMWMLLTRHPEWVSSIA